MKAGVGGQICRTVRIEEVGGQSGARPVLLDTNIVVGTIDCI